MTESSSVEIQFTLEFRKLLKRLSKRYRNIKSDLKPVLQQISLGELIGDRIPGVESVVMKVRVKNSDVQKGKRGGYRLVYWKASDELVVLLSIYSKSDRANIDATEIYRIISQLEVDFE